LNGESPWLVVRLDKDKQAFSAVRPAPATLSHLWEKSAMHAKSERDILHDLDGILRNFEGREYSGEIGPQTRFFADLGCASIDAVVLGETLERHYGRQFPFNEFLSDLGRRGAEDVTVGELASFIHRHLHGN
jgi:acyl carrier protein